MISTDYLVHPMGKGVRTIQEVYVSRFMILGFFFYFISFSPILVYFFLFRLPFL